MNNRNKLINNMLLINIDNRTQELEDKLIQELQNFFIQLKHQIITNINIYGNNPILIINLINKEFNQYNDILYKYKVLAYDMGIDLSKLVIDNIKEENSIAFKSKGQYKYSINTHSKYVNDSIRNQVNQILNDGFNNNYNIETIINNIDKRFENITTGQAKRIAVTEINSARNNGMFDEYKIQGVTTIEWVSKFDGRTRHSHMSMFGERTILGQPFSNGLLYPGDPAGAPQEIINCRCTILPVFELSTNNIIHDIQKYNKIKNNTSINNDNLINNDDIINIAKDFALNGYTLSDLSKYLNIDKKEINKILKKYLNKPYNLLPKHCKTCGNIFSPIKQNEVNCPLCKNNKFRKSNLKLSNTKINIIKDDLIMMMATGIFINKKRKYIPDFNYYNLLDEIYNNNIKFLYQNNINKDKLIIYIMKNIDNEKFLNENIKGWKKLIKYLYNDYNFLNQNNTILKNKYIY